MTSDTLRAIGWMVLSMAAFAVNDFFIKQVTGALPPGQLVVLVSAGCALVFAALCARARLPLWSPGMLHPLVVLRSGGEVVATISYVSALALVPLSLTSAIVQVQPLFVTAGAAIWLGERVGPVRWTLVLTGLLGVLLMLQPGAEGFRWPALLVVLAALGLAARDLASRRIPDRISSLQLAFWAFSLLFVFALGMAWLQAGWVPLDRRSILGLAGTVCAFVLAYLCLMRATRIGEVSAVIPFRYTRLFFALLLAMVFLGERPDALTLLGAAIVVASGLVGWMREQRA